MEHGKMFISCRYFGLFSRRVVGWAIAHHMRETLVLDALSMALSRRHDTHSLLHHSDQGKQYASENYQIEP
jgi:putative transposase